ncbi:type II secretion system protein GspM [Stutzerimonas stutzeri]|uniref:Type II secretion system protein M n=1 Tax=Stutzerimonas stutzeri KOS6 TaxID=1218352 RepID=A0A061JWT4_STUST|nr:type II secretion system protein GspM [Stutzerimonas stutzeri]EWC43374.1 hypothetical protein B597_001390 [Stutzerimonas stutzeri KOS6]
MTLEAMRNHWQALPAPRQRLLLAGWVLVGLMLLYVLARPLWAGWQEARHWQRLAVAAAALPAVQPLTAERWRLLAETSRVLLTGVEAREGGWWVQGQIADARDLNRLMQAVAGQGWQVSRWSLQRADAGLVFELQTMRGDGEAGR